MIKKSIILTMFLLICWTLFIKYKNFSISRHQWQDNIVSAEKFIFDLDSIDNLIIGSSLARRIQMDSLHNFYNLSLGGQSIFDGLNILRNKNNLPQNVFIETNVIVRGENSNFNQIISSPILNTLKVNLPFLRADKKPMDLLAVIISKVKDKIKITTTVHKPDNSLFEKVIALRIENYSKTIDTSIMDKRVEILKNHIDFLESKGVNVILFEMPVNPQLIELNRAKYLRNRVQNDFPKYPFVSLPNNIDIYQTGDGIHLTAEESKLYTHYFKNEVTNILNR